jgi:hypothetical protein
MNTIGEQLLSRNGNGELKVRIASIFPNASTLVALPEVPLHAYQRAAFVDSLNEARQKNGQPPLSDDEQQTEMAQAVDLMVNDRGILIRPDPSRMDLALAADEQLQELAPKRAIQYLLLNEVRVRNALKRRGECWRMFLPPTEPKQIRRLISESRTGIGGQKIYYYSAVSGTRLLTYCSFRKLAELNECDLRAHLAEIALYSARRNASGHPEIEFFMASPAPSNNSLESLSAAPAEDLRARFEAFGDQLQKVIPAEYQCDDLDDPLWRNRMFGHLMTQQDDASADGKLMGLDPDFSMRVEWLPGGRIEEGELIIDPAIEEPYGIDREKKVSSVVNGMIINLVQEFGDLEYVNLGSVLPSATRNEARGGRREVFVAQIKQRRAPAEVLQIIRFQKWGVKEHLDQGKSLEEAMMESEGYTEYVLDRGLGCRQLGMNLPHHLTARKLSEVYDGYNQRYVGRRIWSPYFQRDYIAGVATDQVPARKLANRAYAAKLGRLMGQAAAPNIILGRAELAGQVVFDVGDEIVVEDESGLPAEIIVSDHVGTFADWKGTLEERTVEYAAPIARRLAAVADRQEFTDAYLSGFVARFTRVQEEYTKYRRAFDTLFKHRPFDPLGSLGFRWIKILERLRTADPKRLAEQISQNIRM